MIYVLELENNKYYVGKSKDIEKRYNDHINGIASEWTKIHKPIKILQTLQCKSPYHHDRCIKEYMLKYGIDNVRGGSYSSIELNHSTKIFLQQIIWSSNGLCSRCGRKNHIYEDCNMDFDINGKIIYDSSESSNSETEYSSYSSDNYTFGHLKCRFLQ